ncbi:MAG: class I tRNA ligase family protein [Nanopusillaceae archaeon]
MKKEFILVTAALPYSNNVPHIGHIVGSHLPADIFARYQRFKGNYVVFIGGTDEHGTPTEIEAIKKNTTPEKITEFYYNIHKKIYDWFDISYDSFSRTSKSEIHYEITKNIFLRILCAGFISEKIDNLPFDPLTGRFLPDRYVIGKCPYCGYDKARGDQCENCGKLLDPKDLIEPKNSINGNPVIFKKTKHLYFRLDKLSEDLRIWLEKKKKDFSDLTYTTSKGMLDEGLKERSITRDIKWGIPVPYEDIWRFILDKIFNKLDFSSKDKLFYSIIDSLKSIDIPITEEDEEKIKAAIEQNWPKIDQIINNINLYEPYKNKVFYVWFDAPIGYLSFTIELLKEEFDLKELENIDISNCKIINIDKDFAEIEVNNIKYVVYYKEFDGKLYIEDIDPGYYLSNIKKIIKILLIEKKLEKAINKINWKRFWMEGKIYHFLGKDNIPFHTLFWPGIIIASNKCNKRDNIFEKEIKLPENVFGYAYLTYEGKKISKSQNWGIFCDSLIEANVDKDYWRFYLAYLIPENKDTSFKWDEFIEIINKELVNNIGNLTHRVLKFFWQNYKEIRGNFDKNVIKIAKDYYNIICSHLERGEISTALKKIIEMANKGNSLFQEKKPWENPEKNREFINGMLIYLITIYVFLSFYIPKYAELFFNQINIKILDNKSLLELLENPEKLKIELKNEPKPLFSKIDQEYINKIKEVVTKPKYLI